jgi:hypothetical protein
MVTYKFWSAPSFWTGLIAIIAYSDPRALNGGYVYDDAGSVVKNVVVNGMVPWKEVFTRDYWGTEMKEAQSHKSFRPITTLTLKANYVFASTSSISFSSILSLLSLSSEKDSATTTDKDNDKPDTKKQHPPTFSFHIVNVLLHGIVTGLVTRATPYILPRTDIVSQFVVGFLFGLHPVHAEVVSNITSRGEMLMSWFFLVAFLSYAHTIEVSRKRQQLSPLKKQQLALMSSLSSPFFWCLQRLWGIYFVPWTCMTLSLFSKEQGATTLISLVIWDFVKHHGDLRNLFEDLTVSNIALSSSSSQDQQRQKRQFAWQFVLRSVILAMETVIIVTWRYMLNGETSPDFVVAQNPAGFANERFTRAFSVTWVYCLYIRDAVYPYVLCPDWSGLSIDLITDWKDPRTLPVLVLWYFAAQSMWSMVVGVKVSNQQFDDDNNNHDGGGSGSPVIRKRATTTLGGVDNGKTPRGDITWREWWNGTTLRQINIAVWAFTFSPFLLSSNILVVVGLMKADRVIYLPLFGFCLLEALLLSKLLKGAISMRTSFERRKEQQFWGGHFALMFQLIVFAGRTHDRNLAWSDSLRLWEAAYATNPRSHHTMYNYGYELSIKQRYQEAEVVLRPIGDPRVEGPSNTFVYAMVLFNLKQCRRANQLLEDAFRVIAEKRSEGGTRNSESNLSRTESNLLVAKAHCTEDISERGRVLYQAVEKDPTNEYAIQLATEFMQKIQQFEEMGG